jgi:hypothetical protein
VVFAQSARSRFDTLLRVSVLCGFLAELREINPLLRYFKKIHADPQIRNPLR